MSPRPLRKRYRFAHSAMIALLVILSGTFSVYADPISMGEIEDQATLDLMMPAEAPDTNEARPIDDVIDTDDPAPDWPASESLDESKFGPGPYAVDDLPDVTAEVLEDMAEAEEGEPGLSLIPEPSTLIMLALAALTAYLWRIKW